MKQEPNKLVRNKIPSILKEQGYKVKAKKIKEDADFEQALRDKIVEEVKELASSTSKEQMVEEIADVLEVIDSLLKVTGATMKEVKQAKKTKKSEKGGFSARKLLVSYEN
jgi:predicted house-cleaning noncanonical NTP pyrophosphatase (MazG superfamily)